MAFISSDFRELPLCQLHLFPLQSVEINRHFWHLTHWICLYIHFGCMTPETPLTMLTRSLLQSKLWYVKLLCLFVTQIISKTYHISPGTSVEQVGTGEAVRRSVNIVYFSCNKNVSYKWQWIIVLWTRTITDWISFLVVVFQQETLYLATWLTSTHTSKSTELQQPRSAVTLQTEDLCGPGIQAHVGKISARPLAKICPFSHWVTATDYIQ